MKLEGEQITRAMSIVGEIMWSCDLPMYVEMFVREEKTVEQFGESAALQLGFTPRTQKEFLDDYFPEGGQNRKNAREMIRRYRSGKPRDDVRLKKQVVSDIFHHVTHECELPSLGQLGYPYGSAIYVRASETLGEVKAAFKKGEKSA